MSNGLLGNMIRRPGYRYCLVNIECMPYSDHFNVVMELDEPIGDLLPYLASILPGCTYVHGSGVINLMEDGHIVGIYPERITITDVKSVEEAEHWCEVYYDRIREVRERKESISPVLLKQIQITVLEIYRHLPKTNCGDCGLSTCMAFAAKVFRRESPLGACPHIPSRAPETARFFQKLSEQGFPVHTESKGS